MWKIIVAAVTIIFGTSSIVNSQEYDFEGIKKTTDK